MKLPPDLERRCLELAGGELASRDTTSGVAPAAPPALSEKAFMWKIINFAEAHGWKWYHVFFSQNSPEGFPDLLMLRAEREVVAELKKENEKPTKDQEEWLEAFRRAGREVHVWRPSQMEEVCRILT